MFFHVFGHVKAKQFHTQRISKLFSNFGLTDTCWTGEQIVTDWLFRLTQTSTRQFDRRRQRLDRGVLTEHNALKRFFEVFQNLGIVFRHVLWRDARNLGNDSLDILGANRLATFGFRQQMLCRARFVDDVNRLVRQLAVIDIARGQFNSRFDRICSVFDAVMLFEIRLQPLQDLDRIRHRWLCYVDFLETAGQRAIFFKVLTELFVRRRTHAAQFAALQGRFQQVGRIHRPTRCRTRTDHGVDFVDEQHRIRMIFHLCHYGLQPFLEITAVTRTSQQSPHIKRIDCRLRQDFWHLFVHDLKRQTFGNRGFTHTGITHQ